MGEFYRRDLVVGFQKLFTAVDGVNLEPITILVEGFKDSSGRQRFAVKSLYGEYSTTQEFEENLDHAINSAERGSKRMWSFLPFMLPGFRQLAQALNEALKASEEADG